MKKITALILAFAMCFALAACGAEPAPTPTPMPSAEELAETYKAAIEGARSEQDNADRGIMYTGQSEPMGLRLLGAPGLCRERRVLLRVQPLGHERPGLLRGPLHAPPRARPRP